MNNIDEGLLSCIINENLSNQLLKGNFGLEKENVRVDEKGRLALTPHPEVFGDKLLNPYIKTDFSESQVEVVTPVCGSIEEAYHFLENLQNIVSLTIEGEYLWPQSNPPILPEDKDIPIAVYDQHGKEEREYREKLAQRYGRKKQLLSGIHYNFSFDEVFLKQLYSTLGKDKSYKDFKDGLYLRVTKNFLKYRWLLIYLTGASPAFHNTFGEDFIKISDKLDSESHYFRDLTSLRNSKCGYSNDEVFIIDYDSLEGYTQSIQALIDDGRIESASEFYNPIRLKGSSKKGVLEQLKEGGIKYLELRLFDLNPFSKNGIFIEDLYLIHLLMIYMFLKQDGLFDARQQEISNDNHNLSTMLGRYEGALVYNESGEKVKLREEALSIIDEMQEIVRLLNVEKDYLIRILQAAREKILDPGKTYAHRVIEGARDQSYIRFHMEKAKTYLQESKNHQIGLIGYEDLELSTQILMRDAIRKGVQIEILDREENFLRLTRGQQVEYVKEATKTSLDSYSTVLVMENKVVTKEVLKEKGIIVPPGESYSKPEDARAAYHQFTGRQIVIKPKSTNYGLGISIFKDEFTPEAFEEAVEIAFKYDKTILIEAFVTGKEYRFLVMDGRVEAVLHRVPANVIGDGQKTVRELIHQKNQHPLRGVGHRTPLEKIQLGEIEALYLKSQGKDFDHIPAADELVFLRENSNISTGGDSIDFTDEVHESYKQLAVRAAEAVGAVITGVDIIIEDIKEPVDETNYAVIELNFNPAIYMHCYPYQGQPRDVAAKVLDLLFD